jgi:hypothetical protein
VQLSSLGDVTSIPCEKDDRVGISSTYVHFFAQRWTQRSDDERKHKHRQQYNTPQAKALAREDTPSIHI